MISFFSQGHFLIEPDVKKFNPDFSLDFFWRLRLFPMHNIIAYSHAKKVILTKRSTSLLNDSIIKRVFFYQSRINNKTNHQSKYKNALFWWYWLLQEQRTPSAVCRSPSVLLSQLAGSLKKFNKCNEYCYSYGWCVPQSKHHPKNSRIIQWD